MATKLNMNDLNPGVWFPYGELKDKSRIKLRVCAGADFKKIQKATTTEKIDVRRVDGRPERFVTKKVDEELQNEMIWDFCIVEWEGFVDQLDKPILCTQENKLLLMNQSVQFSMFVADKLAEFRELHLAEEREEEKK